jgi:parallel beta-helix repeat protein
MFKLKQLILASALLSASFGAFAALYYVSPSGNDNTGAKDDELKPYKTPGKVAKLVAPGDTVYLKNGTYDPFKLTISGTSESTRITWKAYPGHTPEVKFKTGGQWTTIAVVASYQTIDGLTVTGNNDNVTLGEAEADYNKSVSTFFLTNPVTGVADINPATGKAVTVDTPNPTYVDKYYGSDAFNNSGIGIDNYLEDHKTLKTTRAHHLIVQNSTVRKFGCNGIVAQPGDYVVIRNNRIYENAWYSRYGCSGLSIYSINEDPNDTYTGYRNIITGNKIWNNRGKVRWLEVGKYSDGNGFILDIGQLDTAGQSFKGSTLVANNLVVNNGGSGIHALRQQRIDIFNNTAYKNGAMVNYADIYASQSEDVRLFNNIVYSRPQADKAKFNNSGQNKNVKYNYNIYYDATTSTPTIAEGTKGANDLIVDPQFVNPGLDPLTADFSLKPTSPAINSGSYIAGVTPEVDIDGVTRITTAIDRGAYEAGKPFINSASTALGTVNVDLTYQIVATNAPTAYAATGLPAGLSINTATGIISGKPTAAGTFSVTASATNAAGTTSATITFTISNLPTGWDVSTTTSVGGKVESVNHTNGKWTVAARTNRVNGNSDSYAALWQSALVNGDVTIRAKVIDNSDDSTFSAAGVTLRETEGVGSIHVSTLVSPQKGVTYVRRTATDGKSIITAGPNFSKDVYVELKRVGNVITSSASTDGGATWTLVRRETVVLKNPIRVGLMTTSSGVGNLNTATFDNVTVIKP